RPGRDPRRSALPRRSPGARRALDRRDARLVPAHLPGRGAGAEAARLGGLVQLPELSARGLQDGADRERAPGELRRAFPRAARRGIAVAPAEAERGFGEALAAAPPLAFPGVGAARLVERERAWWSAVVRRAFGPAAERASFDQCFTELFVHYGCPEAWRVFSEVPEALRLLRARGLKLAVVSNFDGRLPPVLAGLGLRPLLDLVVHSTAAAAAKPDPAIFRGAL